MPTLQHLNRIQHEGYLLHQVHTAKNELEPSNVSEMKFIENKHRSSMARSYFQKDYKKSYFRNKYNR